MTKCENLATRENEKPATTQQSVTFWQSGTVKRKWARIPDRQKTGFCQKLSLFTSFWLKANNAMKRWSAEETVHSETRNSLVCSSWAWVFVWAYSAKACQVLVNINICLPASNLVNYSNHKRTKQRFSSRARTRTDSGGWSWNSKEEEESGLSFPLPLLLEEKEKRTFPFSSMRKAITIHFFLYFWDTQDARTGDRYYITCVSKNMLIWPLKVPKSRLQNNENSIWEIKESSLHWLWGVRANEGWVSVHLLPPPRLVSTLRLTTDRWAWACL